MGPARLIAAKDVKLRIRDRSAFIVGIVAPLGLAFIFNLILGGVDTGVVVSRFAVADLDGGSVSTAFVDVLEELESQDFLTLDGVVDTRQEALDLVDAGDTDAAFIIPEGFSDAVTRQQPATVEVIGDPDAPTSTEIARSIASSFATEVTTTQLAITTAVVASDAASDPAEIGRIATAAAEGLPVAAQIGSVETSTKELDLPTFFSASMSVFFLFFTVSFGVNGLLEEQQQGTIRRLLAAPIREQTIVSGKAIVSFGLGIISMVLLVIATTMLMSADWGDPLGVAILIVAGVTAATGMMMVVAAFAKTPEQAGNLQAILAVGLGMLGGIFFPGTLGTGFLAMLSYLSPHRWFLVGLSDLAGGDGLSAIVPSLIGLGAFAVISWALAMVRFRTKGVSL